MKNSLTNPVKYKKMIIPEAILLTLLIHAVFFALFSVPKIKKEGTERENVSVTLLRQPDRNSDDKTFFTQLANYAPTHFADPHSRFGFSSFRTSTTKRFSPPPEIKLAAVNVISSKYSSFKTGLPAVPVRRNQLPHFQYPDNAKSVAEIEYPFASGTSGIMIPLTFSTDEQRMMKEFPLANSVYKLIYDKKHNVMPRLILLQSCGRRALDKLSTRILYQELQKISQCSDGEIFTVYYNKNDNDGVEL